jgi:hypothetical protein
MREQWRDPEIRIPVISALAIRPPSTPRTAPAAFCKPFSDRHQRCAAQAIEYSGAPGVTQEAEVGIFIDSVLGYFNGPCSTPRSGTLIRHRRS